MLWLQQPNGKPLKQNLVSCCMDMHFPLESCNWVENVYIINVKNFENIPHVMNFLENFWKNMLPWKKNGRCHYMVIHYLIHSYHNFCIWSMSSWYNCEVIVTKANWNKYDENLMLGKNV